MPHSASHPLSRPSLKLLALLGLALSTQASAQDASPQQCRRIAEPAQRLACYDAALPPDNATGLAPGSAMSAATPALAPGEQARQFGLPDKARAAELQAIESAVDETFDGWGPNDRIRLTNGQVWQVLDGSSGAFNRNSRVVKVRRGALGSYFLDFDSMNKSPRVRRVE